MFRTVGVVNHDGNKAAAAESEDLTIVAPQHAEAVRALWRGSIGRTVRCVPSRQTLMAKDQTETLFAKRYCSARRAAAEWRWLERLRGAGLAGPPPVALVRGRRGGMVVLGAVPGRSLDAWALDAAREGWLGRWYDYLVADVAPWVRALHARGWIHRDLNLAHLYAEDPRGGGDPAVIDVERMLRPRLRWQRWVVKELASLLASSPVPTPPRVSLRFLRAYLDGASRSRRRRIARAVLGKAARVGARRPKFG
jgi:hypothetical protein